MIYVNQVHLVEYVGLQISAPGSTIEQGGGGNAIKDAEGEEDDDDLDAGDGDEPDPDAIDFR